MCIIVYKPKGKKVDLNTLKTCYNHNSDGCGFMYPTKKGVKVEKGFMNYNDFVSAVEKVDNNKPIVYHFRIATHGGVCEEMTQPFNVSERLIDIVTGGVSDFGLAHNGIIKLTKDARGISDTALFVKEYASYLLNGDERAYKAISALTDNNRIAIMEKNGNVHLLGEWQKDKGIYYSNDSYKEYKFLKDEELKDFYKDEEFDDFYFDEEFDDWRLGGE